MNIDTDAIKELIALMNENSLCEIELEHEGMRVKLKKTGSESKSDIVTLSPQLPTFGSAPPADKPAEVVKAEDSKYIKIKSPMVGTFYRAPSPDADPFVDVSDEVDPETVVCIIEAMKVMNEIKSECEGKIVEVLVGNGEPVEFGQPLFLVEPL